MISALNHDLTHKRKVLAAESEYILTMARLGYTLACTILLTLWALLLGVLFPDRWSGLYALGWTMMVLATVVNLGYRMWRRIRYEDLLLPAAFLRAGVGVLWLGFLFIWVGNLIAIATTMLIAYLYPSEASGLPVGIGYGLAAALYLPGFRIVGSCRHRWEQISRK